MSTIKLDLAKRVVVNLAKAAGIPDQKAKIILCMDYSGSMDALYKSGFVTRVLERVLPLAMAFDDDQEVECYLFHHGVIPMSVNISAANIDTYVNNEMRKHSMGATSYSPAINKILDDFLADSTNVTITGGNAQAGASKGILGKLFGGGSSTGTTSNATSKAKIPAYVLFITDGENGDRSTTTDAIVKAAGHGIFWQFIGLKSSYSDAFGYLRTLDTMSGRAVDNANFFEITDEDLANSNDQALYSKLLEEYPDWINKAKGLGIIE